MDTEQRELPRATVSVVSLILLVMSIQLTSALLFGRWFFGPGWFGPTKEIAGYSVSALLFVIHRLTRRKPLIAGYDQKAETPQYFSGMEAVIVVILVVAGGCFATWLFVDN